MVGRQCYSFPIGSVLVAGAQARVHSGPDGVDSPPAALKWTRAYIWNKDGDEARLYDAKGTVIDSWSYPLGRNNSCLLLGLPVGQKAVITVLELLGTGIE